MNGASLRADPSGPLGVVWGAVLLSAGSRMWVGLTGHRPTELDRFGLWALGARSLGQGVFQLAAPTTGRRLFLATELLHATSMLALAGGDRPRRRPALVSASVALTNAALMHWCDPRRRAAR
jgi:hypothetical protein